MRCAMGSISAPRSRTGPPTALETGSTGRDSPAVVDSGQGSRAAAKQRDVLILGKRVGNELVAPGVPARSACARDCAGQLAAIPEELIESDSSDTSAARSPRTDKRSQVQMADRGPLPRSGRPSPKTRQVFASSGCDSSGLIVAHDQVDVRVLGHNRLGGNRRGAFRGILFPAQRHSDLRAAAARSESRNPGRIHHFVGGESRESNRGCAFLPPAIDAMRVVACVATSVTRQRRRVCSIMNWRCHEADASGVVRLRRVRFASFVLGGGGGQRACLSLRTA